MDPNATLKLLREALTDLNTDPTDEFAVDALRTAVADLDEWLSEGGFLPLDWTVAP